MPPPLGLSDVGQIASSPGKTVRLYTTVRLQGDNSKTWPRLGDLGPWKQLRSEAERSVAAPLPARPKRSEVAGRRRYRVEKVAHQFLRGAPSRKPAEIGFNRLLLALARTGGCKALSARPSTQVRSQIREATESNMRSDAQRRSEIFDSNLGGTRTARSRQTSSDSTTCTARVDHDGQVHTKSITRPCGMPR